VLVLGAALWPATANAATSVSVVATSDHRNNSNGGSLAAANLARGLHPQFLLDIGDFAATSSDFNSHYKVFWGSLKPVTRAVPGNHELNYGDWKTYFTSAQLGSSPNYLQTVDLGAGWEFIGLEAFMEEGTIGVGSAKYNFLKAQLAAHPGPVIVGWHSPRYTWSTTPHRDWAGSASLYNLVKAHGRAIIVNGDQHGYQRLAEDGTDGATEFVDAAGGAPLYPINTHTPGTRPALKAFDNTEFGVLHLVLRPTGYDWMYHAQSGIKDTGTKTF
jgi:hypothetical protein